jgi:transcriptional regulator with XRE-family HTH domain
MHPVAALRALAGATQAQLAQAARTSQPAIAAYESGAKSPTYRTLERLASSLGLELHAVFVPPMTREERRSLDLHRAVAAKLAEDPERVLQHARRNVDKMRRINPGAAPLLEEWRRSLEMPVRDLVDLLVDPRPRARELRHVTPFAGALTPRERWDVYRRFRDEDAA